MSPAQRADVADLRAERNRAVAGAAAMRAAIEEAMETAARRWSEWGGRAEAVRDILAAALRSDAGTALLAERDRLREAVEFAVHQKGNLNPERYVECVSAKARAALGGGE